MVWPSGINGSERNLRGALLELVLRRRRRLLLGAHPAPAAPAGLTLTRRTGRRRGLASVALSVGRDAE
jgi:hypothetical protein